MTQLHFRVLERVSVKTELAYYPGCPGDADSFEIAGIYSTLYIRDGKRGILHRVTVERFEPLEDET